MSIWQYSRGGDRAYRSREDQKDPSEELTKHEATRGENGADRVSGAIGANKARRMEPYVYAKELYSLSGGIELIKTHICMH